MSHRERLGREDYLALQRQVLERDGWRCQGCGRRENLQLHHLVFRSHGGGDSGDNLITLCPDCHRRAHGRSRGD